MGHVEKRSHKRVGEESGAVVVLFALVLVVLFGAVAFAIDLSRLFHERQVLQNAVDFGALAGAQELPAQDATQGALAESEARKVTLDNAPWLDPATINVTFKCVVGDRDGDGVADLEDIPYICGPASGTWSTDWKVKGGRAQHLCDPYAGDKCNTIAVRTSNIVNYVFAPVIGIEQGNTGSVSAASCRGACGGDPNPLDVVMVIDRTGSMTAGDLANAKNAALSVLDFYDSSEHHVGVVALPYGRPGDPCNVNNPQLYPQGSASFWQVSPLSSDYDNADGSLNTLSSIVQNINCLRISPSITVRVNGIVRTGAGHTNLGDPLDAAREMLLNQGRSDVEDVIIFMTDGEANQPDTMLPCNYLNTKANIAKGEGQTIYTIAYGVAGARCRRDTSGAYLNAYATTNLANAATAPSPDDFPGGCAATENTDGDYYFCESGSSDLEPVFRQVAAQTLGHSRLVEDL